MLLARKRQWAAGAPSSDVQMQTTNVLVHRLLREHYDAERSRALAHGGDGAGAESLQTLELHSEARMVEACVGEALTALRARRGPDKVPDYFCCKITMEVMLDPVSTPDGITCAAPASRPHGLALLQPPTHVRTRQCRARAHITTPAGRLHKSPLTTSDSV